MSFDRSQIDLFPTSGIADWLPSETMFSMCSRYHKLSGNILASTTCKQLFGHGQKGTAHDLPSRVDVFVQNTRGLLGTTNDIIRERTLLPFYLPFRSAEDERAAFLSMAGNGIGSMKFQLGILTSRFGANHPLKACAECMQDDQKNFGTAYWHLSHQLPGVWICLAHKQPLMVASEKSNGIGRFLWLLPDQRVMTPINNGRLHFRELEAAIRISQVAEQLLSLPRGFHFDSRVLVKTYHSALSKQGLLRNSGKLNNAEIGAEYSRFARHLSYIPDFSNAAENQNTSGALVLRLLRNPRSGTHPLRHILLICWLFDTWSGFWDAYLRANLNQEALEIEREGNSDQGYLNEDIDRRQAVIAEVKENNLSARRAAANAGVDVATAMAWLAEEGISSKRRPKKLKEDIRQKLVADLKSGMDKVTAARKYVISESTVMKTLKTEVGLYNDWLSIRFDKERATARSEWLNLQRMYSDYGAKKLRAVGSRVYAWLYRNDRAWMVENSVSMAKPARNNHSSIDWDVRDSGLAKQVMDAAASLLDGGCKRDISLPDLYRFLPHLRAKIRALDKLPLTGRAIRMVTSGNYSILR
ncbi:TniQ family protein [Herbaspirillum sp. AP02]|nr:MULTISPECIES: TnsD family Tn7-like transposition protein [unclassified Herbaspirillum]MBG7622081.1 TniQ family protein [Herbaspirillum sp. AP02]NZD69100.1 TniQ family protein [Herbaspirillum sp. AP21]